MRLGNRTMAAGLASVAGAVSILCLFPLAAQTQEIPSDIELRWGVKVPLRDGVKLNSTIYLPKDRRDPLPVVFTLTPYISDTYHDRAMYFARHGYIFALVDVRGRGNSEGQFEPFANEGRDGHDVVEWFAGQPFSNGQVTMWGGSYAGFDQWSTLKEFPPHLTTVVPAASAQPGVDFPFNANIFYPYNIQWITYTSGVTPNVKLFGEQSLWQEKFWQLYSRHLPFHELDKIVGIPSPIFQKWLANPVPDPYWDAMIPSPEQYAHIRVPILTITGHYDGDQPGAMAYYRDHMRFGAAEATARHYLIIGPWDHAGTRTPNPDVGGLHFGPASTLDMNKLHKEWYDWTMKGGSQLEFLKKRVAYYVVGPAAEKWKYADNLDSIATEKRTLYLHSKGEANDVFHSGTLAAEKPGAEAADRFTYDPLDTRYGALEREATDTAYLTSQLQALNRFGNGAIYHTEPFAESTEITGYVRFIVWMAMDVPDTDFEVSLYEILADRSSVALSQARLRARYRESLRQEKLVKPGEAFRHEFNNFSFFSRQVSKGSRLRLVLNCSDSMSQQKNYNSGGVVADESAKDARTAHVTVYHDAKRAGFLELPLVK